MEALIQISRDLMVDARELHGALKVDTDFRNWVTRRIKEYGFIEGKDFRSKMTESGGGRPSKEYAMTISMAKELCMVEKTDPGRKWRLYFIKAEESLRARSGGGTVNDSLDAVQAWVDGMRRHERRLQDHDADIIRIDTKLKDFDSDTGYASVLAYGRRLGRGVPVEDAKVIGRYASQYCGTHGLRKGTVKDERWGVVGSYPIVACDYAFKRFYGDV